MTLNGEGVLRHLHDADLPLDVFNFLISLWLHHLEGVVLLSLDVEHFVNAAVATLAQFREDFVVLRRISSLNVRRLLYVHLGLLLLPHVLFRFIVLAKNHSKKRVRRVLSQFLLTEGGHLALNELG